jgi:hypothetical protein
MINKLHISFSIETIQSQDENEFSSYALTISLIIKILTDNVKKKLYRQYIKINLD